MANNQSNKDKKEILNPTETKIQKRIVKKIFYQIPHEIRKEGFKDIMKNPQFMKSKSATFKNLFDKIKGDFDEIKDPIFDKVLKEEWNQYKKRKTRQNITSIWLI